MKCRLSVPITATFMFLKVKNQEQALSSLLISNILDKKWLMMLLHKSPEKLPESQRVLIPMHPERNHNTSFLQRMLKKLIKKRKMKRPMKSLTWINIKFL